MGELLISATGWSVRYGLAGWGALAAIYAGLFVAIWPAVAWAGARIAARG